MVIVIPIISITVLHLFTQNRFLVYLVVNCHYKILNSQLDIILLMYVALKVVIVTALVLQNKRSLIAGKSDHIDGLMSDHFKHSTVLMI